jgi:hypothetical protein
MAINAPITKHARWAALLIGLVFGAFALAQTVVLTGAAVVTEVNGSVQVRIGNDAPRPLQAGNRIPVGAVVITGSDANAVLAFADGQVIVLGERTIFRIVSYEFDQKDMSQSGVFLNLIEGSARLVMGAIGQFDPRLIRIQVGAGTLIGATNPEGGNAADAGVVVQGASTMVTVTQGRVVLTLPSGQGIVLGSGQGAYVQPDGSAQQGSAAQIATLVGQTPDGQQIVDRMDAMQSFAFPQRNAQTVITLATPGSIEAATTDAPPAGGSAADAASQEQPPAEELATFTSPTVATGAGGGGTPCGASCS